MANPEHLAKLREGVKPWNEWRKENRTIVPDLVGADLHGANLFEANLTGANLRAADLRQANLGGASLTQSNLENADLREAELSKAYLIQANLSATRLNGAKLRAADVRSAGFNGAYLFKADLTKADLRGTFIHQSILTGANLEEADLRYTELFEAELAGANLTKADLSGSVVQNTNFRRSDLRGANLSRAKLDGSDFSDANAGGASFAGASLVGTLLLRTNLERATLSGCVVYGISAWDVNLDRTVQSNLIITPEDQPVIQVDNLEIAQFIYLLLSRQKLRDVITTIGEKAVLILGRFTERKELLDRMADKLRLLGYIPMILDFDRPTDRDLTETVKILAGLSRFVIADVTNPRSVPLELQATVPDYMVPFVTILQRGQPAFGMFDDLPRKYHWALPLLEYNNADTLLAAFEDKVVAPALEKVDEVRKIKAAPPASRSAEE